MVKYSCFEQVDVYFMLFYSYKTTINIRSATKLPKMTFLLCQSLKKMNKNHQITYLLLLFNISLRSHEASANANANATSSS